MQHIPIRLGPLALLLTVISICMTVLAILSFTTARADFSLAQKYASTVRDRYILEKEGQSFLREIGAALGQGQDPGSLAETDEAGILHKTLEYDDFRLLIGIVFQEDSFRVVEWRFKKDWIPDDGMGDLWDGTF